MLLIASTAHPAQLDKILAPIFHGQVKGLTAKVVQPEELQNAGPATTQLLMGSEAFGMLVDGGVVHKKQKLGSSRERLFSLFGRSTLVTYDPGIIEILPELGPDVSWDVNLAIRHALTGSLKPITGKYQYVENFDEVIEWLDSLEPEANATLSCDLETTSLDEFDPKSRILTIAFSYTPARSLVYQVPETGNGSSLVFDQVRRLLTDPRINTIGANYKYDMRWMHRKWGIVPTNHRFDTQLVGGLIDENRFNSLKLHCKIYVPLLGGYETEFDSKWDKDNMEQALKQDPEGFLTYSGGDTDAGIRVYSRLKNQLVADLQLARFYTKLLHPASLVFRKLESRGMLVDMKRYAELQVEAETASDETQAACINMLPWALRHKYSDNLKLTRPVILRDFLFTPHGLNLKPVMFTEKDGLPSTAWDHLKVFLNHPEAGPFATKMKEFKSVEKTLKTYIIGFMKHVRADGRFHPSYMLAKGEYSTAGDDEDDGGANTGRSSCKDPAYQTQPKHTAWAKRLRSVYPCPPGYVIVKLDVSQGELRIMADASDCKKMIEAYMKGLDLHAITAANFMGLTLEQFFALPKAEKEMGRYLAKACNFGLIYRISPEGLRAYAANSYKVIMSSAEAETYHAKWFEPYPEIHKYHEHQVEFARRKGFVRNQFGRVRHLPLINSRDAKIRGKQERQAINSPTQGCLFDMVMLMMVMLDRWNPDLWIFGNTHDSLEMYLPEHSWEADIKVMKGICENLPLKDFGWNMKVPVKVDFEVSHTTLAETEEYKIAA
jgi:DNA polymerase I-like protein with 3'-5' exonuclease and polymerase domains